MFYYSFKNRKNGQNHLHLMLQRSVTTTVFSLIFHPAIYQSLMDGELTFLSIYLYLS